MKIKRKSIATVLIISLLLPFTGCSLLPELPDEIPLITPASNPFEGSKGSPSESGTPSQDVAKPTQTPTPTSTPSPTPTATPTATNTPTPTPVPHEHKFELTSTYEHTVVCPLCGTAYTEFVEYTYSCRCGEDKKERKEMSAHACPTNTPTPTPTPDPVKACDDYVWTTGSVNLREEADASSAKLTSFASGTKLHRTGIHENGWSRVEVGSYIGFISGKYVSTLSPTPTSTPTPDVTATPTPWFTDEELNNNISRKMWLVETDFDKYGYFDGFTADFAVAEEWLIKNERGWQKNYNPDATAELNKGYMTVTLTGTYDRLIPVYNNQACNTSYPIYCYLRGGQTGRVMQAWYRFGRTTFTGFYGMWFVCNDYYEICPTYTEFMFDAKDPNHKCTVVTKDKITGAVIKTEYLYDETLTKLKPYMPDTQYLDSIYITDDVALYDYDPTKK